ncbi:outer membrane protein assembly factor BamE [Pseudosulfitobacter sp. SM2401]|uniref:outer membrane protein assembly factor BamE n=1 Tax=Pseudosulfitobacter sp. SM2401 TaxID=3350098 RepID=UPI0036F1F570
MRIKSFCRYIAVAAVTVSLTACAATYTNHGYIPPQEDLDLLVVGVDTRSSVEDSVGSPSSGGVLNDGGYYYVRSRIRSFGPTAPKVVERQVLAISFDTAGVVTNIERFGLEDGNVVPIARRVTDSAVSNKTFLRQLLGNIGRIAPG